MKKERNQNDRKTKFNEMLGDKPILRKLANGGELGKNKNLYLKLFSSSTLIVDCYPKKPPKRIIELDPIITPTKEEQYAAEENQGKTEESIERAIKNLKDLTDLNIYDKSKCASFTLTYNNSFLAQYSRNPEDYKKVAKDFGYFIKKLRKKFVEYRKIEYVYMKELQKERNVYHIHGLLIANDSPKPFNITMEELQKLWTIRKGTVGGVESGEKIKVPYNYLTPHKNNSNNEFAKKMNERAENLKTLPRKSKLYVASAGLIKPTTISITEEELLEIVKELKECYPHYRKKVFASSYNDGYGSVEFERRTFEIPEDPQLRYEFIKKVVEFVEKKTKNKK